MYNRATESHTKYWIAYYTHLRELALNLAVHQSRPPESLTTTITTLDEQESVYVA